MEQILTVKCWLVYTAEQNSLLFSFFKSTRKGKLCVAIFSGDVVFSLLLDLCILAYLPICNDGGHTKRCLGTFIAKFHD